MQVKRVIDPEAEALRLAEMRRLQRQMKGVKLQYIAENDTVFFDDVAGIGEAKVCFQCLLYSLAVVCLFRPGCAELPHCTAGLQSAVVCLLRSVGLC